MNQTVCLLTLLITTDTVIFLLLKRFQVLQNRRENIASQVGGLVLIVNILLVHLTMSSNLAPSGVVSALVLIVLFGLWDDKFGAKAPLKLTVQTIAAILLVHHLGLSLPFFVLSVVVIVLTSNAMNLSDGIDGLCAIICLTLAAFFIMVAGSSWAGNYNIAIIIGLVVFMLFNLLPERRVILGDTGSLMLGLFVGFQAVANCSGEDAINRLAAISLLLAYPVSDTLFAILRRIVDRRNILQGDRFHIHHILTERLGSQRKALAALSGLQVVLFAAGLMVWRYQAAIHGAAAFIIAVTYLVYYGMKSHLQHEAWVASQALVEVARVRQRTVESGVDRDD